MARRFAPGRCRPLLVLLLLSSSLQAAAEERPSREELLASLRARSVRPISEAELEAEASRLEGRLAPAELEALIAEGPAPARLRRRAWTPQGDPRATTAGVLGDARSELLFVPLAPCRVFDTRLAGGAMSAGSTRAYRIAGAGADLSGQGGNPDGCGIPLGAISPVAAAVALNLVAVSAQGYGWITAWEFGQPMPAASVLDYSNVGVALDLANGFILPIAGVSTLTHDLSLHAANSAVHLVADVTGYFTRVPLEQLQESTRAQVAHATQTTLVDLADGACKELVACTVTAPVAGTVVVDALVHGVVAHTAGTLDRFVTQVETVSVVTCPLDDSSVSVSDFEADAALGTSPDLDFTLGHQNVFSQSAGTTRTYRASGAMKSGAGIGDAVESARAICTFIPD